LKATFGIGRIIAVKKVLLILVLIVFSVTISYSEEKMRLAPAPVSNPTFTSVPTSLETIKNEIYGNTKASITPEPTIAEHLPWYEKEDDTNLPEGQVKPMGIDEKSSNFLTRLLNMTTSLIIVCLLIYVVLKLFYAKGSGILPQPKKNLSVLEQIQLQPQKTIFLSLVKIGGKVLLLGVTEKEISVLREFEKEEFISVTKTVQEESPSPFNQKLTGIMEQRKTTGILSRIFQIFGLNGLASVFSQNDNLNRK